MDLPNSLIIPNSGPVDADLRVPGSKSLTNRALLIAGLAEGRSRLGGMLHSDDTHYMSKALEALGVDLEAQGEWLSVLGAAGSFAPFGGELYVENAGTAARFLTAALGLGQGPYRLDGNARMRQRPIGDLIEGLKPLGVEVLDLEGTGCPPLRVQGKFTGGQVTIRGDKSSQYLSALMLTAPCAGGDTRIEIDGPLVSRTYVEMTRQIMSDFGAQSHWEGEQVLRVPGRQGYQGRDYEIEGDASSASYFFGLAAVTGGRVKVRGLQRDSTQGDLGLIYILEQMGCTLSWESDGVVLQGGPLKAVEVDMNSMSDVAPTLAVVALFAEGRTVIRNVANMRIKECDRITAVCTELRKLGAVAEEFEDGLAITGGGNLQGAELETYDDHRMAMCFSLAGLKLPGVKLLEPACVTKTFPRYFQTLFPLLKPLTEQDRVLVRQMG
ncbi:MAG: 3-phosphoshikimate 1-carboxyvinyltransferase [bacterium]|nr:3-phosphoshikimate 1-carboxyvinyltransferase [bacterium]